MRVLTDEMIQKAINHGWTKEEAERGYAFVSNPEIGNGAMYVTNVDCINICRGKHAAARKAEEEGHRFVKNLNFFGKDKMIYLDTPDNRKLLSKVYTSMHFELENKKVKILASELEKLIDRLEVKELEDYPAIMELRRTLR